MHRTPGITTGNATETGQGHWGWMLGHFMPAAAPELITGDVEVQWANLPAGARRAEWGYNAQAHTLAMLVRGRFHLHFPERDVLLTGEGDYVLWEPGVPHFWEAEEDTLIVTVRWPSVPGDSQPWPGELPIPGQTRTRP